MILMEDEQKLKKLIKQALKEYAEENPGDVRAKGLISRSKEKMQEDGKSAALSQSVKNRLKVEYKQYLKMSFGNKSHTSSKLLKALVDEIKQETGVRFNPLNFQSKLRDKEFINRIPREDNPEVQKLCRKIEKIIYKHTVGA